MIIRHKLEKLENTSEQHKNNQLILAQLLNDKYSKAHKILDPIRWQSHFVVVDKKWWSDCTKGETRYKLHHENFLCEWQTVQTG